MLQKFKWAFGSSGQIALWEFCALEPSRKGIWAAPSFSSCLRGRAPSRMVAQEIFSSASSLFCGKTCVLLEQYQLLSSHPFSCASPSELIPTSAWKQEGEGKLLQRLLNSYSDTLILFLAALCFGLVCFFQWRWEGWVDGKERGCSLSRACWSKSQCSHSWPLGLFGFVSCCHFFGSG